MAPGAKLDSYIVLFVKIRTRSMKKCFSICVLRRIINVLSCTDAYLVEQLFFGQKNKLRIITHHMIAIHHSPGFLPSLDPRVFF